MILDVKNLYDGKDKVRAYVFNIISRIDGGLFESAEYRIRINFLKVPNKEAFPLGIDTDSLTLSYKEEIFIHHGNIVNEEVIEKVASQLRNSINEVEILCGFRFVVPVRYVVPEKQTKDDDIGFKYHMESGTLVVTVPEGIKVKVETK